VAVSVRPARAILSQTKVVTELYQSFIHVLKKLFAKSWPSIFAFFATKSFIRPGKMPRMTTGKFPIVSEA
jgi:hypothetical protein